jgi:hypothetical protein
VKVEEGGFDKFVDSGIMGGDFLSFAPSEVNEATCAGLCSEMPNCLGFTFRVAAEKSTEASQCRFKDNSMGKPIPQENRNSYIKIKA